MTKKTRCVSRRWLRTVGVCRIRCSRLRLRRISLLRRTWRILADFFFCINNCLCIGNFKNTHADKVYLDWNVLFAVLVSCAVKDFNLCYEPIDEFGFKSVHLRMIRSSQEEAHKTDDVYRYCHRPRIQFRQYRTQKM